MQAESSRIKRTSEVQFTTNPIVNHLKSKTTRKPLQEFSELRSKTIKDRLWSCSYFVAFIGYVTDEIVKRF